MMEKKEELRGCFRRALALAPGVPVDDLVYQDNPQWDSVAHMRLVADVETTFKIMLTTDEILEMSDFKMACSIVERHGVVV